MKVIFLDRDGTMGGHGGGVSPKEFRLYKETAAAIKRLNENHYSVIMITNQSRIARGYFMENEFITETDKMINELKEMDAYIMDYFYCPHDNDSECSCHKPKTGLVDEACEKYPQIDLKKAFFVGDNGQSDMILAERMNMGKILVKTGWGKSSLTTHRHHWQNINPDYAAENILDAVQWILSK